MNHERSKVTCRLSLTKEIFEIFNNSSRPLHIGNWRVFSLTGRECFRFDGNISIPQYKALLLRSGHITDLGRKDHIEVHWSSRNIWNNAGDVAALVDANSKVVAMVEEGRPYNNWPTDGLQATKLDEMQLMLMLIHAGFEKELPGNRGTLTKPKLVELYEQWVIPKVISTPKRRRAAAGLSVGESASKRFKDTPKADRPDWQPVGHIHGNQDAWLWQAHPAMKTEADPPTPAPKDDRPPWIPPGTPKQSDAWLYDPSASNWSAPRQSSTTPRSIPGTQLIQNLVRRLTGHGPSLDAAAEGESHMDLDSSEPPSVSADLAPKMLNFATEVPGRSISEMSIGSLPAGQSVADGSPVRPLLEDEEEEDESSLEPPLVQSDVVQPDVMAAPTSQLPVRESFIQSQQLRRRSNAAGLYTAVHEGLVDDVPEGLLHRPGDTSSYVERMPHVQLGEPLPGGKPATSTLKRSGANFARVAWNLLVWLLCVALIGWCICLVSRPSRLFCDTEKMGASRIHTNCVPCEEEGFCAQGRLWACKDKGAAREQCIKDWAAFYVHLVREHVTFWTVRVLGATALLWWPARVGLGLGR